MNKKVLLVIMDGIGYDTNKRGNAVYNASTPNLDFMMKHYPNTYIKASGLSVGLPSDSDMGNSEVGHNAIGCGQIYNQGASLVNESIKNKSLYQSNTWKELIEYCSNNTLHFIGLLSDGNVHSNIEHLKEMIKQSYKENIKRVRVHILLDGRDVSKRSALTYVEDIEKLINQLNSAEFDIKIASGGGRMTTTMDRYYADINMVKLGYDTHVLGIGRMFRSAREAIETYRLELDVDDQYLPNFVIGENNIPNGIIEDNDSVIFFNFRGDRAIEFSRALSDDTFDYFDTSNKPKIYYAGMLQYDGDLLIPNKYLVSPPMIKDTLTEYLVKYNKKMYAISETQKYGHVTYFFNGNKINKISEDLETWVEIPSTKIDFNLKPEMEAYEITKELVKELKSNNYDFYRVNYPNGDMVGHTGDYEATIRAVEVVDECLGALLEECHKLGITMIVTADHGNADEMYEDTLETIIPKTSHTLNVVPFIVCNNNNIKLNRNDMGLSNIANTIVSLMGIEENSKWNKSIIKR